MVPLLKYISQDGYSQMVCRKVFRLGLGAISTFDIFVVSCKACGKCCMSL